jgi:hypothetical protein
MKGRPISGGWRGLAAAAAVVAMLTLSALGASAGHVLGIGRTAAGLILGFIICTVVGVVGVYRSRR